MPDNDAANRPRQSDDVVLSRQRPASAKNSQNRDKHTRIQVANRQIILAAALDIFSVFGFRGSTVDRIAEKSGMSKPNIFYYFSSKEDIYRAVLEQTLSDWLEPLADMDRDGDPLQELRTYIVRKMQLAREQPEASRLFANEILNGAPVIEIFLNTRLKDLVDDKASVIQSWIDRGQIKAISPQHLIFMIWSTTQHYSDFDVQVRAVLGADEADDGHFDDAQSTLLDIILNGLRPG